MSLSKKMNSNHLDMTPSPRHAANNPVSICGWLHKMKRRQRAFLPAWVHRWFTIEGDRLHWYRNKGDGPGMSRGSIDLESITAVREFESGKEGVFSFVIYSGERTLLLRAVNKRDLDRWVSHLRLQLEYLRGGAKSLVGAVAGQDGFTPRSNGAGFDRRDIKSKSKTGYDKVLGRLDAALEHLTQLEQEVTRVNPSKELVIDEREDQQRAEAAASATRSGRSSSSTSSTSSSKSSKSSRSNGDGTPRDGECVRDRAASKVRKQPPPPPEGAPLRRRPSLPTTTNEGPAAASGDSPTVFARRELVDISDSRSRRRVEEDVDGDEERPRRGASAGRSVRSVMRGSSSSTGSRRQKEEEDGRKEGKQGARQRMLEREDDEGMRGGHPSATSASGSMSRRYDSKEQQPYEASSSSRQRGAAPRPATKEAPPQFNSLHDLELVDEEGF